MRILLPIALFCQHVLAQEFISDPKKLVTVESLRISGTRLLPQSVTAMTGLKAGMQLNEMSLLQSLEKLKTSGLITRADYVYESIEGKPEDVVSLELKIKDQLPLLPVTFKVRDVEPDSIWAYLQKVDPLFTREAPPTEGAAKLYIRYSEQYLRSINRDDRLVVEMLGDKQGNAIGILLKTGVLKAAPKSRK